MRKEGIYMDKELIQKLIQIAKDHQKMSYAPYSNFHVSAALLTENGNIYKGINFENAAYSPTICAERSAVAAAVNAGDRKFTAIAVVGGPSYTTDNYCPPCGVCRQVLREFADPQKMIVILAKSVNDYKEYTLDQLLPESFGPGNLK